MEEDESNEKPNVESIDKKDLFLKKYECRNLIFKVPKEIEFYAIIKKLCVVQSLTSTKVLCVHCVPGNYQSDTTNTKLNNESLKKQNEENNTEKYMVFFCKLSESTFIESDYPQFSKNGIFAKWILNKKNELEFIQKQSNLQLLSNNENLFKNLYLKYF